MDLELRKISELSASTISDNSDLFLIEKADGATRNLSYYDLVKTILLQTLIQGNGVNITEDTTSEFAKIVISSSGSGQTWYITNTAPTGAIADDIWLHTDSANFGDIDQYNGTAWVTATNMRGATGEKGDKGDKGDTGDTGAKGDTGNDGYSVSITATPITGGTRLTISSTDPEVLDQTFDIMDGTETIQTTSANYTATLTVAGWSSTTPYTQTVTVQGMTSSIIPIIGLVVSSTVETGIEEEKQWAYVTKATSGTDSITFSCYETKPTVALTVNIKAV